MKKLVLTLILWFAIGGTAAAVVNVNTATKEELKTIKGIGDKRAQEIIDYRKKNGEFKSVDDLEKVPGIGPGTMKQIRSQVSVSGKTTIDKPAETATKAKGADAKTAPAAKADAMKTEKAKDKVAEKSKAAEKGKAETKSSEKASQKAATKETKDEKKTNNK